MIKSARGRKPLCTSSIHSTVFTWCLPPEVISISAHDLRSRRSAAVAYARFSSASSPTNTQTHKPLALGAGVGVYGVRRAVENGGRWGGGSGGWRMGTHMAPVETLLRVVEQLGRLHEDIAHIVAQHDQGADAHQALCSERTERRRSTRYAARGRKIFFERLAFENTFVYLSYLISLSFRKKI